MRKGIGERGRFFFRERKTTLILVKKERKRSRGGERGEILFQKEVQQKLGRRWEQKAMFRPRAGNTKEVGMKCMIDWKF